jgi:Zn-dependent membrane protease YugP
MTADTFIRRCFLHDALDLLDSINSDAPVGLNRAFQASKDWAVLRTANALVTATAISMTISFLISAAVLFVASRNVIVGVFLRSFLVTSILLSKRPFSGKASRAV